MHKIQYSWTVQNRHLRDFAPSQGGLYGSSPFRSDGSRDSQTEEWILWETAKGTETKLALEGHQAQVHSDQMVLMMVRQEAEHM